MRQTNAKRQKQYRQRTALSKVRNEYGVTIMLQACKTANIDAWPTIVDCANAIFAHNGDGLEFVRRIAPLLYSVALTRILIDRLSASAYGDRHQNV